VMDLGRARVRTREARCVLRLAPEQDADLRLCAF
jgi:hypothetical protein